MAGVLTRLTREAHARRLVPAEAPVDFQAAVGLVRDMPYHRASDRRPETIVREWRGTCSGKHYALDRIAGELQVPSQLYHCTHRFTAANVHYLPDELRTLIPPGGLPDVHTFLRARLHSRWVVLDVTWPASLQPLGFPVNLDWDGVSDMTVAADVEDEFPVRGEPQAMKERLIAEHCAAHLKTREQFILGLTAWLNAAVPP